MLLMIKFISIITMIKKDNNNQYHRNENYPCHDDNYHAHSHKNDE